MAIEKKKAYMVEYYQANKEARSAYNKVYRQKHRERLNAKKREWWGANKERVATWRKEYYQEHHAEIILKAKAIRARLKLEVLSHYSNGKPVCARCRITDIIILCIDHIDGGGNAHRRSIGRIGAGAGFYKWLRKNNYPAGFQVLCYNCNQRKKWERQEYGVKTK